ncbi:MAG: glucosyltransferase [Clostridia bacterium]|nr:glucosyltransferase [Clostridia bacterium]
MACIFFFSLPAHGHVNPTLPLVRELTTRGHKVVYYETEEFRERIEAVGAAYVSVEPYMPPAPENIDRIAGKDFAALIEMIAETALSLDKKIAKDIADMHPDLIIGDSVCFWGRLFAKKHGIPFVCSTTTFAFNQHSAGRMKPRLPEILRMIFGMPRIEKSMQRLRNHGYPVSNFLDVIQNDPITSTIVFTSRLFQPQAETFGENYAFVGPSVPARYPRRAHARQLAYISLGTVLHNAPRFYRSCIRVLKDMDCDAIISVGSKVDRASLGEIPANVQIFPRVNQLEVLASADVFLTHCGMNSVSESLLCGVPMVLFPQHSEQEAVAGRTEELGAGLRLKKATPKEILRTLEAVRTDERYKNAAQAISDDFSRCGGAKAAADFIEERLFPKQPD